MRTSPRTKNPDVACKVVLGYCTVDLVACDKDEDGQGTRKEGDDEMKKTEANDSNRGRKQLQQSMWTVDGTQFLNQQRIQQQPMRAGTS